MKSRGRCWWRLAFSLHDSAQSSAPRSWPRAEVPSLVRSILGVTGRRVGVARFLWTRDSISLPAAVGTAVSLGQLRLAEVLLS